MNRHGLSNHPLYRVWNGMKQRCKNPHDDFFYCYGDLYSCFIEKFVVFLKYDQSVFLVDCLLIL